MFCEHRNGLQKVAKVEAQTFSSLKRLYSLSNKELLWKAQESKETAVQMIELAGAELTAVCEPPI